MLGRKSTGSSNTLGAKSKISNATFGRKNNHIRNMVHHPIKEDETPKKSDLEKYSIHP